MYGFGGERCEQQASIGSSPYSRTSYVPLPYSLSSVFFSVSLKIPCSQQMILWIAFKLHLHGQSRQDESYKTSTLSAPYCRPSHPWLSATAVASLLQSSVPAWSSPPYNPWGHLQPSPSVNAHGSASSVPCVLCFTWCLCMSPLRLWHNSGRLIGPLPSDQPSKQMRMIHP